MVRCRLGNVLRLAVLSCLLGVCSPAPAAEESTSRQEARDLARRIDRMVADRWAAAGVTPAPRTDDAEFIRRLYLDLAGRIPSILEVRDFLDDDRPDKRYLWTEQLLESDGYANHFANVWRALLLARAGNEETRGLVPNFEFWLRQRLRENAGYDRMVRELLTAPPSGQADTPNAFLQLNELKPENLAASTSRLFLGVNLECAQCHAHPTESWTRVQFWEFAAFFAGVAQEGRGAAGPGRLGLGIPGTEKVVQPKFLNGAEPAWKPGVSTRTTLAEWVTAADNPYFARTVVNQVWENFFGTGLVEMSVSKDDNSSPGHPELLDELARAFTAHRFDLKFLIRAVLASRAYQLTSAAPGAKPQDPRLFARMAVRPLTPEQLFDSLAEATEFRDPAPPPQMFRRSGVYSPREEFLAKFASPGQKVEAQTSILQALFMMNGKFMTTATTLAGNRTLATIAEAAGTSTARRLETLYLVALSRKPRPEEAERLVRFVDRGGPNGDPKAALADIFWALLNSSEFRFNH
jgi:hypothetical protein